MNKSFYKKFMLSLILIFFSFVLASCIEILPPPTVDTGTVKISIYGDYKYNIKMDGKIKFQEVPEGIYTLNAVSSGYHDFEAIDTMGASFGYDEYTIFVDAGRMNYVYLNPVAPTPTPTTGTLKVVIMNDGGFAYNVYLGGDQYSGEYLGQTSGSSISGQNSAIFSSIPTGVQTIFVISSDGKFSKYRFPKIIAGNTVTIEINVK
jgi:hypothetical protein